MGVIGNNNSLMQKAKMGLGRGLINNEHFIQNQLHLCTQNMFCIMKSLATWFSSTVTANPKTQSNYSPAGPSHNMKAWVGY